MQVYFRPFLRSLLSITFPQGFQILDIRLQEVGAKRRLNGTSKVNTHTDKHTSKHTDKHTNTYMDKSTYRKHWPRGPMLWKVLPKLHSQIRTP